MPLLYVRERNKGCIASYIGTEFLGDRYKLESAVNREIDNLPDYEKEAIKSTYITDDSRETLWACLINLTDLIYKELEGSSMPISKEMLVEYYNYLKQTRKISSRIID